MHVVLANNTRIPAIHYGGTERVIWWLGKELVKRGHRVTFLVQEGSECDFAKVLFYNPRLDIKSQIPDDADIVHLHFLAGEIPDKPVVTTVHGNPSFGAKLPLNSIFVSGNHASRYGSKAFVHNGVDFSEYGDPGLNIKRTYFHFLAKAAWRVKNVQGAIELINNANDKLVVIGGSRLNFKMGFRFTPYLNIKFKGSIGGEAKNEILRHSKGLLFPVLWHEPFGLSVIESMYFGCPVFGTPYGSLPELITKETGFLSDRKEDLIYQIKNGFYLPEKCHEHAVSIFNSEKMALKYLHYYDLILRGEPLNETSPTLQEQQATKFLPFY